MKVLMASALILGLMIKSSCGVRVGNPASKSQIQAPDSAKGGSQKRSEPPNTSVPPHSQSSQTSEPNEPLEETPEKPGELKPFPGPSDTRSRLQHTPTPGPIISPSPSPTPTNLEEGSSGEKNQ
jgi:hypothetical protein